MRPLLLLLSMCHAAVNFTVLLTSRMDGNVLPSNQGLECFGSTAGCTGGADRRAGYLQLARTQNPNTLILDMGGAYFGRSFYSVFKTAPMASYMNAAGYDAASLEIPDFHGTSFFLREYLTRVDFPVVCSNIDVSADPLLNISAPLVNNSRAPLVKPFLVFTIQGVKIGIVSMIEARLQSKSHPSPQTLVNPLSNNTRGASDGVRAAIGLLKQQHSDCNIIILLAGQYYDDSTLADIKLVLSSVWDIDVAFTTWKSIPEQITTDYVNALGQHVWVPQNIFTGGSTINKLRLYFDDNGALVNHTQSYIYINNGTPSDSGVLANMTSLEAIITKQYQTVIGYSNISQYYDYMVDSPMKHILTDIFYDYCASLNPAEPCDFVILNAGGYTASLPKGNITVGAVKQLFPFDNQMSVFVLQGSYVSEAIATLLAQGSFPVCKGLRFAWNPDAAGPQKLVELEGWSPSLQKWAPLNGNFFYKIVTSSFLRGGGAGLTMFQTRAANPIDNGPIDSDLAMAWITANSPLGGHDPEWFQDCRNATLPLAVGAGDCIVVETQKTAEDLNVCPRDRAFCSRLSSDPSITSFLDLPPDFFSGNLSTACVCSGVGTCSQLECDCLIPSQGRWAGVPMFRGADCADLRSLTVADSGLVAFLQFLGSVEIIGSCFVSAALLFFRKERVVKASAPLFGHLIALGCGLGGIGVLLIAAEKTAATCNARVAVCVFGFGLVYASLFSKTWRTHRIFNQKNFIRRRITDFDLLKIVGVVQLIEVVLLLVYYEGGLQFLTPTYFTLGDWSSILRCSGSSTSVYFALLLAFNIGLLLWGVYLAFRTRNVSIQEFNESKLIAAALYNTSVSGILALVLGLALGPGLPVVAEAVAAIAIAYVGLFTLLIVYVPKFISLFGKQLTVTTEKTSGTGSVTLDPLLTENAALRAALTSLGQDVEAILKKAGVASSEPSVHSSNKQ